MPDYLTIAERVIARQEQRKRATSPPLAPDSGMTASPGGDLEGAQCDELNELTNLRRAPGEQAPAGAPAGSSPYEITTKLLPGDVAGTLRAQIDTLLPAIHAGCRRGLAAQIDRTPAEIVTALLADADPAGMTEDAYAQRCREAGDVAALATLVAAYRGRLRQLQAMGEDIFIDAAALELALLWQPAGGSRVSA